MEHDGNNNGAHEGYGWPNIEAKYTSTTAPDDFYRHLLAEETTTSLPETSSTAAKEDLPLKEISSLTHEPTGATKVGESSEARMKFSNAKSISSTQFFGDHKKSTLEMFSVRNVFSLLGDKTIKALETLGSIIDSLTTCKPGNPQDIRALRKDVTDLMQLLHGEDAQAIPWDTRREWVDYVCDRVGTVTCGVSTNGPFGERVVKLRNDAWDLRDLLINEMMRGTCKSCL